MQCPLCGRDVPELAGGLCAQCASERRPFITAPDVLDVVRCAHCGKLQRHGVWKRVTGSPEALVQQALREEVDVDPQLRESDMEVEQRWEDERNAMAHVRLSAKFDQYPVQREAEVRIRLKTSVCNDCSREYGGYFEAIVQVRAESDRVLEAESDAILDWVKQEMDRYRLQDRPGAFLSKTERVRGGFDLYAGNHEVAKLLAHSLADRYGASTAESTKLVGRKDGRDLTRTTVLVRLPAFLPGDFVQLDGRLFKVVRRDRRRITLWDMERTESVQREVRRIKDLRVVGTPQDEHDAVVVSRQPKGIQVLDPVTFKTVDLSLDEPIPEGDTVRVFRHDDRIFVVPPQAVAKA